MIVRGKTLIATISSRFDALRVLSSTQGEDSTTENSKKEVKKSMSKKHFRLLAEAIAGIHETDQLDRKDIASLIGRVCMIINGNFNWDKWNKACGVSDEPEEGLRGTNFEDPNNQDDALQI